MRPRSIMRRRRPSKHEGSAPIFCDEMLAFRVMLPGSADSKWRDSRGSLLDGSGTRLKSNCTLWLSFRSSCV
jgi:hypothetical protein